MTDRLLVDQLDETILVDLTRPRPGMYIADRDRFVIEDTDTLVDCSQEHLPRLHQLLRNLDQQLC
jgi:hypothetical protein